SGRLGVSRTSCPVQSSASEPDELGPNAERVRDGFERWNAGDHESVLDEIHPDVEIQVASSQLSGGKPYRGHEGYREWNTMMRDSFELWQVHPDVFHETDNTVVVLGQMHLRGR